MDHVRFRFLAAKGWSKQGSTKAAFPCFVWVCKCVCVLLCLCKHMTMRGKKNVQKLGE